MEPSSSPGFPLIALEGEVGAEPVEVGGGEFLQQGEFLPAAQPAAAPGEPLDDARLRVADVGMAGELAGGEK